MPDAENKTVFISYRREASQWLAQSIFLDLRAHGYDVFKDVDSIDAGQWERVIMGQIAARAHFLLILIPGTLDRCIEPDDMLRKEIERAMELERNIILVFVNGFSFEKSKKFLTGQLEMLPTFNGFNLDYDYFDGAMALLRNRFLKGPVQIGVQPSLQAESAPTKAQLTAEKYFQRAYNRPENDLAGKITDYSEAIRLNPEYQMAYNNRGVARYMSADLSGAIADYNEAIRLNPNDSLAYNNRGTARRNRGDKIGAIEDFTEAIRLNPQYPDPYANRGMERAGNYDVFGAIADLQHYLDLGGGNQNGDQELVEEWIKRVKKALASLGSGYQ